MTGFRLSSASALNTPPNRVRTTVRTTVIVIGILVVTMWATVAFSIVSERQNALDRASRLLAGDRHWHDDVADFRNLRSV